MLDPRVESLPEGWAPSTSFTHSWKHPKHPYGNLYCDQAGERTYRACVESQISWCSEAFTSESPLEACLEAQRLFCNATVRTHKDS